MIEIVKGPQGALYGKNAIGGAINIYTNSPTNTYQNKIDVGYGNGNTFQTQASFSGPLLKDKIFYRASGSYKNSDGIIYNDFLKKDVDFLKDFNARLQLKFIFSPNVTTTVSGQIIDTKGGATYYAHTKSNPDGSMAANDFNNIIDADQFGRSTLKNTFISQNTQIKGDKVVYKIITSVNNAKRYHEGDLDFGSADVLRQNQNSDSDTYNQEFRLSDNSPNSKFKWMAGAFYQYSKKLLYTKATADFGFFAPPFAATGTQSTLAILSDFTNKTSSLALFGFADYKLSTKLTASFGFRYDNDNIKQDNRLTNTTPSKSEGQFQPKLSLAYQATQQVLAYANFGCGYRSGGFNSSATIKYDSEYKAETSNNYELGIKTSTKDNRFIFNAAAFIVDFKDQQQYTVTTGGTGLVLGNYNLDKTKVTGFEIDIKWRASKFLDILGGYGKTKSEIIEGGKAGTTPTDYSKFNGNITPLVPSNNYYVALQSNIPINNKLDFNGFVNLGGKGKIYWHEDNNDVSDSFTLLDARFGVTINKKISITAWGDNLLNTKYYDEYYAKAISGGGYDIGWKGRPATYGLLLAMKF
jgi:iron complex outermembrane receptor protein